MAGRPSDYKPAYCQELIDCLAEGYSVKGFAGKIGKSKDTVFEWIKAHEDFAEAYAIAQAKSAYHWETGYIEFAKTGKGNAAAYIFALKNRSAEEWADKVVNEITGKDGGALTHKVEVTFVEAGGE